MVLDKSQVHLTQGLVCTCILGLVFTLGDFTLSWSASLIWLCAMLLLFSYSVVSDFLWPHGLQHARLPCPSPSPWIYSDSCPLSWRCHPTISSSSSPFFLPSVFPSIRVSSNELALCIRRPKYWSFRFSFSISSSNEYWRLISFRIDWFALLAVQVKSLL